MNAKPWTVLCVAVLVAVSAIAAVPAGGAKKDDTPKGKDDTEAQFLINLSWQIALDRASFSPGLIDGDIGGKTRTATKEFQTFKKLKVTGELDSDTATALEVQPEQAVAEYTVLKSDLEQVGDLPKGWLEKSKLKWLPYPSLDEALAEKFHCTRGLLTGLNDGKNIAKLKAGDKINVPNIRTPTSLPRGEKIDISFSRKIVRVKDAADKTVAMFHCSIAADKANGPSGEASVAVISENPHYSFDPDKWPEVKGINQKLLIPPGPRNPVGLCWVGLSIKGYGIHGSPAPEMIGKTGSHGCFRLTNWDAVRLGKIVRVGVLVTFSQ
jgi:lipoprotein-anchoring transpeptidase ErfK/SrfK